MDIVHTVGDTYSDQEVQLSFPQDFVGDMQNFQMEGAIDINDAFATWPYVNGTNGTNGSDYNSTSTVSSQGSPRVSPIPQVMLKNQLRKQIEYYFSRENLNHDSYLVSQMDHDQYVDIAIIANFNQVKKLTSDLDLIIEVLKDSQFVQVDEVNKKVRPLHKRTVIILREIPEKTTQSEIEELFTHSSCPAFVSIEQASGTCWYVHFDTEEQTQQAFHFINDSLQTFKGQRISARIKAKPSSSANNRSEQRPDAPLAVPVDPRSVTTVPSSIQYPVQLQHVPLQAPPPFALPPQVPYGYPLPYLVYLPYPGIDLAYDMNMLSQPQANHNRMTSSYNTRHFQNDRRNHSRTNSAASEHSEGSAGPITSNNAGLSNKGNTSHHSYNNQNRPGYIKNGGEKPNKIRTASGSMYTDQFAENIPPRHRDNHGPGYKVHKQRQPMPQNNQSTNSSIQNHSQHFNSVPSFNKRTPNISRSGAFTSGNNANVTVSATSQSFKGVTAGNQMLDTKSDKSRDAKSRSVASAETDPKYPATAKSIPSSLNKSKSPDKEIEISLIKPESFELDTASFPALPGATNSSAACAAVKTTSNEVTVSVLDTEANLETKHNSIETPCKTIDTNKAKSHETTLSEIVKGTSKPVTTVTPLQPREINSTIQHKASTKTSTYSDKNRPAALVNGTSKEAHHHGHKQTKGAAQKSSVGPITSPSPMASPTGSTSEKHQPLELSSPDYEGKGTSVESSSPTDQKPSYAAMIQRPTANVTTTKVPGTDPPNSTGPAASLTGDNNNNAESKTESKANAAKPENLYTTNTAKQSSSSHGHKRNSQKFQSGFRARGGSGSKSISSPEHNSSQISSGPTSSPSAVPTS